MTLWQPWASLVVAGVKRFETRSWATSYRGPLAIHAAKLSAHDLVKRIGDDAYCELADIVSQNDLPSSRIPNLPRGVVLGTVELVDCHHILHWDGDGPSQRRFDRRARDGGPQLVDVPDAELALGDWSHWRYAWQLADPVAFTEPVPVRGSQGLWEWAAS